MSRKRWSCLFLVMIVTTIMVLSLEWFLDLERVGPWYGWITVQVIWMLSGAIIFFIIIEAEFRKKIRKLFPEINEKGP